MFLGISSHLFGWSIWNRIGISRNFHKNIWNLTMILKISWKSLSKSLPKFRFSGISSHENQLVHHSGENFVLGPLHLKISPGLNIVTTFCNAHMRREEVCRFICSSEVCVSALSLVNYVKTALITQHSSPFPSKLDDYIPHWCHVKSYHFSPR